MDVSTDDLSAFLTRAWNNAKAGANTLPDQLETEQQAALNLIATAGSIASVGKNSAHQAYGNYGPGNLTSRQITQIYTRLKRDYFTLKKMIQDAFANAAISITGTFDFDDPIYDGLIRWYDLNETAEIRPSIINLNLPVRHGGVYPSQPCLVAQ